MKEFQNPNGTYNGVKIMAAMSGLSEAEIDWTWRRLFHLIRHDGKSKDEAKEIVKNEARDKPWERK